MSNHTLLSQCLVDFVLEQHARIDLGDPRALTLYECGGETQHVFGLLASDDDYAVVLDPETLTLDHDETARLRADQTSAGNLFDRGA